MSTIAATQELPVTFGGLATFNICNAMAAALAAFIQGIDAADIHQALLSFIPSPEQLPGRMNMFDFGAYKVIVDYAHNAHGLQSIGNFLRTMPASKRIGVIAGVGDRRDEDIIALGAEAAKIFDEIIIRQDDDLRGRKADELNGLVYRGICQVSPGKKVIVVPDEKESALAVLERAERGMIATIFADDVTGVIEVVNTALASGNYIIQEKELA